MYIDTHAHLGDPRFDADRNEAIARAQAKGVDRIIEIGCQPQEWKPALDLARTSPGIYCALGVHPQEAKVMTDELWKELGQLCTDEKVVLIGETGLDYHYENSPRLVQKKAFCKHLEIARELKKPLSIHCREAYKDMIELLEADIGKSGFVNGVIHCFSGTLAEAEKFIAMGFLLGIDGPVTYPSAKELRYAVERLQLENILLETDAPYLPPQLFRGKRNEPSYIPLIAEEIANIKETTAETVAEITTRNAVDLLKLK